jgi:hypothetical protein
VSFEMDLALAQQNSKHTGIPIQILANQSAAKDPEGAPGLPGALKNPFRRNELPVHRRTPQRETLLRGSSGDTRERQSQVGQTPSQTCGESPREGCHPQLLTPHTARDSTQDIRGDGTAIGNGRATDSHRVRSPSPKVLANLGLVILIDNQGGIPELANRP